MDVWRYTWRLANNAPGLFWANMVIWAVWYLAPLVTGLATRGVFDALSGHAPLDLGIGVLLAFVCAGEAVHVFVFAACIDVWVRLMAANATLLRANLLRWLVLGPGPKRLPGTPGEAVSRFREDVDELWFFIDTWIDLGGQLLYSVVAIAIMASIDTRITAVLVIPLLAIFFVVQAVAKHLKRYRRLNREATARITSFIGELFGAVLAVKVAAAEQQVTRRFEQLSAVRRDAAVKDRLFTETLNAVNLNLVNVSLGLVLLLGARQLQDGSFTIGDFALFAQYLGGLTGLPRFSGWLLARQRHAAVAIERMDELMTGAPHAAVVNHGPVYLNGALPAVERRTPTAGDRLEVAAGHALTVVYPDSGRGIRDITLTLPRGSFTVVTGKVGAGKTTLLKALLGLVDLDGGMVCWNGRAVDDPATLMTPPRCAYTPQAPVLFSDRLRANILLGRSTENGSLDAALDHAVLGPDLADMPLGLETLVGPRGVRLSGGQMQRTAAARMFAAVPELLVFDDLSSALDVETEAALWERLAARGDATCLVVSHRRAALRRAGHIIVLDGGIIAAEGSLDDLLQTSPELQAIWEGKLVTMSAAASPPQPAGIA